MKFEGIDWLLVSLILGSFTIVLLIFMALRYKKKRARTLFASPEMGEWQSSHYDEGIVGEVRIRTLDTLSSQETSRMMGFDVLQETENQPKRRTKTTSQSLIVLNVMAPNDQPFVGYEMLQALLTLGLRFGEMNIFHRYEEINGKGKKLFSLASAVEPGIFDLSTIGGLSCPGLTLFMDIESHTNPMTVFDIMLETARQLADDLGGTVRDLQRQEVLESTITKYREQIRKFA